MTLSDVFALLLVEGKTLDVEFFALHLLELVELCAKVILAVLDFSQARRVELGWKIVRGEESLASASLNFARLCGGLLMPELNICEFNVLAMKLVHDLFS